MLFTWHTNEIHSYHNFQVHISLEVFLTFDAALLTSMWFILYKKCNQFFQHSYNFKTLANLNQHLQINFKVNFRFLILREKKFTAQSKVGLSWLKWWFSNFVRRITFNPNYKWFWKWIWVAFFCEFIQWNGTQYALANFCKRYVIFLTASLWN